MSQHDNPAYDQFTRGQDTMNKATSYDEFARGQQTMNDSWRKNLDRPGDQATRDDLIN